MTDEEKAEQYVENKYHCNQSECIQGNSCDYCYREESKRDYLAGLAEGRNEQRKLQIAYSNVLEKENAKLSKMLEVAINDTIRKGNQCFYCKDNYTKDICDNCTEENRINVMKLYRAELEIRVENEK